jgi:hypothetical protein
MIGAFIHSDAETVGAFDPMRVLAELERRFGTNVEFDLNNVFDGHVEKYIALAPRLNLPPDNVVVQGERRKAHKLSPRYHFRLRTGDDSWVRGKVDRHSIYLHCARDEEVPQPLRERFIEFLRSLRLGEFKIETSCEHDS